MAILASLSTFYNIAKICIVSAPEGRSLPALIAPQLRILLLKLSRNEQAKKLAQRALRALAGFAKNLKLKYQDIEVGVDLAPEAGLADNGDLEQNLQALLETVGTAAQKTESALIMFVDEMQYVAEDELAALVMALHPCVQRKLPIALVGGKHSWDAASASPIKLSDVRAASRTAVAALDESFFRVRFDRLTPAEKKDLRAMAELGPGPHRSGDIATCLKRDVTSLGPTRNQLIAKGVIWSLSGRCRSPLHHFEVARHELQHLGDILVELAQLPTAVRADAPIAYRGSEVNDRLAR